MLFEWESGYADPGIIRSFVYKGTISFPQLIIEWGFIQSNTSSSLDINSLTGMDVDIRPQKKALRGAWYIQFPIGVRT